MTKMLEAAARRVANAPSYRSPDERRVKGKALRDAVPRVSHAGWKAARATKNRRNAIGILLASNRGRIPELIPIRFGRMSSSPFAFYRGAPAVMAADLATIAASSARCEKAGLRRSSSPNR